MTPATSHFAASTSRTATRRTIWIVDDNAPFRSSAEWWLSSAGYDVREFDDPQTAFDALSREAAGEGVDGCLLLDVRMPGMSGLELHDRLNDAGVRLPVIYMTGHGDVPLAVQAMQKGAVTFLEKPFADAALEQALERAFSAQAALPSAASASKPSDGVQDAAADDNALQWQRRVALLTPREREVLEWVLQDKLNKQIAGLMGISIKTVELHRARMMDKLQAVSSRHLVKMAVTAQVGARAAA